MSDIVPADTPYWQAVEDTARELLCAYGYSEIRLPLVEKTELFARTIGAATDIVEKEMYTFSDRSGDSLSLRPEGTAGCVRAGIEHGLLRNQAWRFWYMGPMFRHERPQKGRYRQFYQIGVEAFAMAGPAIDAEMLLMTARLWRKLGVAGLRLELNSLGSGASRTRYREALVEYFEARIDQLDADSRRRLETNPLRILDSKNPDMQPLISGAPRILDYLDEESAAHFRDLCAILDESALDYVVNPRLVRGLDYYTATVFEWTTERLGAQGTVCAGGRFDGLVAQMGGPPTPAVGYAIGLERLIALMKDGEVAVPDRPPHAYLAAVGCEAQRVAHALGEGLREQIPGLRLLVDAESGSFKAKLKRADRSGAAIALIMGEDEVRKGAIAVKDLRDSAPQQALMQSDLGDYLAGRVVSEPVVNP